MASAPPSFPASPSAAPFQTAVEHSPASSFLWKNLFTESTLSTSSPSSTLPDGTPVILAPPDILLNASAAWSGYILCQFFGDNPSPAKIFSDFNPIWGRQGKITVKSFSEGTCLIFVPSLSTRKWILDSCLWSAGTVSFAVLEWSPTPSLICKSLTSAPAWLTIRGLPPQLWSEAGAKLIASRLGSVVPSSRVIFPPDSLGTAKIRVILRLNAARPPTVIVQDSEHNQVRVSVDYGRLPPLCPSCNCYGHLAHRCPSRRRPNPASSVPIPPTSNSLPLDSASKAADIASAPVQPPPSSIYLPPADSDLVSAVPNSLIPATSSPVLPSVPAKSSSGDEVLVQNPNPPSLYWTSRKFSAHFSNWTKAHITSSSAQIFPKANQPFFFYPAYCLSASPPQPISTAVLPPLLLTAVPSIHRNRLLQQRLRPSLFFSSASRGSPF